MNSDIIPAGSDSKFIERWADRKAKRSTEPRVVKAPRRKTYPQEVIDAAVAAYGVKSMSVIAAELGVPAGTISHWWADARRDGAVKALFGRHDGARVTHGRLSKAGRENGLRVEPATSRDEARARRRNEPGRFALSEVRP